MLGALVREDAREMAVHLPTWGGRSEFAYTGSVAQGTEILYGRRGRLLVTYEQYEELLRRFRGRTVVVGTQRRNPPAGSLGEWLRRRVTRSSAASYVAQILVHEGYAERGGRPGEIRFGPATGFWFRAILPGFGSD